MAPTSPRDSGIFSACAARRWASKLASCRAIARPGAPALPSKPRTFFRISMLYPSSTSQQFSSVRRRRRRRGHVHTRQNRSSECTGQVRYYSSARARHARNTYRDCETVNSPEAMREANSCCFCRTRKRSSSSAASRSGSDLLPPLRAALQNLARAGPVTSREGRKESKQRMRRE